MPTIVKTCCCGCNLRNGAIGIAVFTLVVAVVALLAGFVALGLRDGKNALANSTCHSVHPAGPPPSNDTNYTHLYPTVVNITQDEARERETERERLSHARKIADCISVWKGVALTLAVCLLLASFLMMIAGVCLIVPTNTKEQAYPIVWMVLSLIGVLLIISSLVYASAMGNNLNYTIITVISSLLFFLLEVYFVIVVISYYQKLGEKPEARSRSSSTASRKPSGGRPSTGSAPPSMGHKKSASATSATATPTPTKKTSTGAAEHSSSAVAVKKKSSTGAEPQAKKSTTGAEPQAKKSTTNNNPLLMTHPKTAGHH